MNVSRYREKALVALFFLLLWLPLADNLIGLDPAPPADENRALAPPPPLAPTRQNVAEFPRRFEAWYDDRFGFRNLLVRQYHTVKTGWLRISDLERTVIGRDGWLYLGGRGQIDEARGLNPSSPEEIAAWATQLKGIRRWQEDRGGRFLLVLIPDKYRVFPDYLPDWFVPSEQRRKEQLMAALSDSGMEILDLTPALRAARAEGVDRLWLKTDTHWTGVGAYYGYREIAARLGMDALPPDRMVEVSSPPAYDGAWHRTGNLAGFLGVRGLMPEDWVGLVPAELRAVQHWDFPAPSRRTGDVATPLATRVDDGTLPDALFIGDSFRWALVPHLSGHFGNILFTDYRYCFFDPDLAKTLDPDVILFAITEDLLLQQAMPPGDNDW